MLQRVLTRNFSAVFARHFTEQELKGNGASLKPVAQPTAKSISSSEGSSKSRFNIIERSRWPNGIPAVMGAHLMGSGTIAPLSTSKGALLKNDYSTQNLNTFIPLYSMSLPTMCGHHLCKQECRVYFA